MSPVRLQLRVLGTALFALVVELTVAAGLSVDTDSMVWLVLPVLCTSAGAAYVVQRTGPLYRAIGRTPPSPAAVRDALRSPMLQSLLVLAAHGVAAALSGEVRWGLTILGFGALASFAQSHQLRSCLRPWLAAFPDQDLRCGLTLSSGQRLATELALALGGVALVSGAVLLSTSASGFQSALVVFLAVTASGAGAWLGLATGDALDRQFRELARRVDATRDASSEITLVGQREPEVLRVRQEVASLAEAYLEDADREDRAREGVEALRRKKTLFLASMSHDLRSPLNAILGFSELLAEPEAGLSEGQRQSAMQIYRAGAELLQLLNDILDSARFDAGKLALNRAWAPAVDILNAAQRHGETLVQGTSLQIVSELQAGLPPVFVDRERIVQAVVCLLRHAARSMDSGVIRLRAWVGPGEMADELRVEVVDRSEGIRSDDKERIFEAFRELSLPSGRRIGGLGLGMSLARSLVRAHGGRLDAESSEVAGTTFTVCLPVERGEPS